MKRSIPFVLLLTLLLCLSTGCHRQPAEKLNSIAEWLADDPKGCIEYYNSLFSPTMKQVQFKELEQQYARLLRAMPEDPDNPEAFVVPAGQLLFTYYKVLMRQDDITNSEHLIDSLQRSGHRFYTGILHPEVLAVTAKFLTAQSRMEEVDSIGRLFIALPPTGNPQRDMLTNYMVGWTLSFCSMQDSLTLRLTNYALQLYEQGTESFCAGELLGQAGYLAWKNGNYAKATDYNQKAIDWYAAHPDVSHTGLIDIYNDQSRIYVNLGLFDKALEANERAIRYAKESDNFTLEEVYRLRSIIFNESDRQDSALYWVQQAAEVTPAEVADAYLPLLRVNELSYRLALAGDSAGALRDDFLRLMADSATFGVDGEGMVNAHYGMTLLKTPGCEWEGVNRIEKSFRDFLDADYSYGVAILGDILIRAYIQTNQANRIADVYPVYMNIRDEMEKEKSVNAAIGANIRYETGRKEQENRVLTAEVSLKERSLVYTRVILILSVLLLLGAVCLIIQYRRLRRQERESHLNAMNRLLSAQRELNRRNETLSAELEQAAHTEVIDTVRQQLNPSLLSGDDEVRFRQSFAALHPRYLPRLRNRCPEITKSDELVCMLVYLRQNTDEIALALGISRASVNSARSRIRKKLGMQKEESLDEYLQGIS